jgi:hypothetical protein
LRKIINLDCQIEIIGYWIYCFNSKEGQGRIKGTRLLVLRQA